MKKQWIYLERQGKPLENKFLKSAKRAINLFYNTAMVTRYCRASNQGKHMKIYLSGPISNDDPKLVAENIQAFLNARVSLLRLGHGVVSPIMNGVRVDAPWVDHMRADIIMMMGCDAVALLPGFAFSKGANIEADLAVQLGFLVRPLYWWLNSNLDSAK